MGSSESARAGVHRDRRGAQPVRAVIRAARILRGLARSRKGESLADLSTAVGLHKATTLRLLRTLMVEQIVMRDPDTDRYSLNPGAWIAMAPFLGPARLLLSETQDVLDALSRSTAATAMLVFPDETRRRGFSPMYAIPVAPLRFDPSDLPPAPLHMSASGRCYLASLPGHEVTEYVEAARSGSAGGHVRGLKGELRRVRRQGYSLHRLEATFGVVDIAVPLYLRPGAVAGCLGLACPADGMSDDTLFGHLPALREAAEDLSQVLAERPRTVGAEVAADGPRETILPSVWDGAEVPVHIQPVQRVRSVSRMIRLMASLMRSPEGASLGELARQRGLARATAHRVLRTLAAEDIALHDPTTRCWRISPLFWLRLASQLRSAGSLAGAAARILKEVADIVGATATLMAPDSTGGRMVVIDYALPDRPICYRPGHEAQTPLHALAVGKCYLANQPGSRIVEYLRAGFVRLTEHTITSHRRLLQELALVRRQGYALNRQEALPGIGEVAVPVADGAGRVVAAFSLTAPIDEITERNILRWVSLLRAAARPMAGLLSSRSGGGSAGFEADRAI
jgi:IclR family acetate operon transcriptional repressor